MTLPSFLPCLVFLFSLTQRFYIFIVVLEEIEVFLERTCLQCAPKPCTALDLLQATTEWHDIMDSSQCHTMRYLPTGLPGFDQNILGGVRIGTITEVVGRAGSGTTQHRIIILRRGINHLHLLERKNFRITCRRHLRDNP
jgi:hypothetical protein